MTEGKPEGGVFNIASQRAGVINNVAGDQRVQVVSMALRLSRSLR